MFCEIKNSKCPAYSLFSIHLLLLGRILKNLHISKFLSGVFQIEIYKLISSSLLLTIFTYSLSEAERTLEKQPELISRLTTLRIFSMSLSALTSIYNCVYLSLCNQSLLSNF